MRLENCYKIAMKVSPELRHTARITDSSDMYVWVCFSMQQTNVFSFVLIRDAADLNTLQWRHNDRHGVSNHQAHDCLLNRLFRRKSKKASKLRVTGLCEGNSPGTGEFPARRTSDEENVSIWWRHYVMVCWYSVLFSCTHIMVTLLIMDQSIP